MCASRLQLTALCVLLLGWLGAGTCAIAQLPSTQLNGIYPAGGSPASKFDMTIAGIDLDNIARLHFSHPGITAEVKMGEPGPFDTGPQPLPNQFVITVAGDVPPGQYDVRAEGLYGVSNARLFEISTLPEASEIEPNSDQPEATAVALPAIFNGQIGDTADVDWIRFQATAGERILVNCLARRIDSRLDALVRIVDSTGRSIAEAHDSQDSDPLIDFTAPADGDYFIVVRDSLFAGGPEYVYRLRIGRLPHIDFIFPPAGPAGSQQQYTIYGRNLPGGQASNFAVEGRPLEQLTTSIALPADVTGQLQWSELIEPHESGLDPIEYRISGEHGTSNPIRLTVASAPVVVEQEPNSSPAQAQQLSIPCEVAGQFYPERDSDWFTFTATQAEVIVIDVYSHRLGAVTDPALVVQQVTRSESGEEQVAVLAQLIDDTANRDGGHEFDIRSRDPSFRFVAPADGTYRLYLRDSVSALKKDPRLVYRLALRREQPDFRLVAIPDNSSSALLLRKGGSELIRVVAFRQDNFDGEIRLSMSGLPGGVTSSEGTIGPASNVGTLVINAADNAGPTFGAVQVVGKAVLNGQEITRVARPGAASFPTQYPQPFQMLPGLPARLTRELVVSVSAAETAGVSIAAGNNQIWETSCGGILKIPYSVVRRNGFNGNITGMITQLPQEFNVQQQVDIGGGVTSGEFQLNLNSNTPTGTYTFVVNGFVQGYEYRRNPDAAQAAADRKAKLDQIVNETTEKSRVAMEMAAEAQRVVEEANAALQVAMNAKDGAVNGGAAPDVIAAAERAVSDAIEKIKVAEENKTAADQQANQANELSQQAMQVQQEAEQRAQQLANDAQPRQFNFWTPSTPVTIRIAPHPITLEGVPESVTVKQGATVEVPLRITRLFGFDQSVNVQASVPGDIGGLQINSVELPNGQADNKLQIMAATDATPGTHALEIVAQMNFNGNGLELRRPMTLIVEEVVQPQN